MTKRKYHRYFTKQKKEKINPKNIKIYDRYLRSNTIKNPDVKESTYKTYKNYVDQFFVFLSEEYDNVYVYDEYFLEESVDIMEDFIAFCQESLGNNKKVINTKLSAISSFFNWSVKRGNIESHPFDGKLERMKGAKDEQIMNHYFLNEEQTSEILKVLDEEYKKEKGKYDIQDLLLFKITLDSANRNGAISKLRISKLDKENMMFVDIREKRGKIVEVPFDEDTLVYIEEWLEIRKELDGLECDGMFIVKNKGEYAPMSQTALYMRVRKIGQILGIKDLNPHSIRKTTINNIVETTGDLDLAREYANHEDVSTTTIYVKPKSKSEVREKIEKMRKSKEKKDRKEGQS